MRHGRLPQALFVASSEAEGRPRSLVETPQELCEALPSWERHPFYRSGGRASGEGMDRILSYLPR